MAAYQLGSFSFDSIEIAEYGTTAIGFLQYSQEGSLRGVTRSGQWLITDVWDRSTGRWQLVARSAILKDKAP